MNRWRKNRPRRTSARPQLSNVEQPRRPSLSLIGQLLRPFASFIAALRFLTILPLPGRFGTADTELAHSAPFFPLVGLVLGYAAALVAKPLFFLLPPLPAAVLTTFVLLAFSGGLHLDGLADTADGFFSARSQDRMLEIMKDSNIGTMGALVLILTLLLKTVCLASLNEQLLPAIFLMPLAGRTAILLLMALLPYVRQEGLGRLFTAYFHTNRGKLAALAALFFCAFIAFSLAGAQGLIAVLAMLLMILFFAILCQRKIGGATGDTLGAACELAETVIILIFTVKTGLLL